MMTGLWLEGQQEPNAQNLLCLLNRRGARVKGPMALYLIPAA